MAIYSFLLDTKIISFYLNKIFKKMPLSLQLFVVYENNFIAILYLVSNLNF